jgi:hypothetical protein
MMMRKFNLILLLLCAVLVAAAQEDPEQVRIYQPKTDSYTMINVIDLLGEWSNISSVTPTAIRSTPESFVSLVNGYRVRVNDIWVEDYPTKMRNCTWSIVDSSLILSSPDLGKVELEITRVGEGAYYEFVLNQVTYRKLVNRSSKTRDAG